MNKMCRFSENFRFLNFIFNNENNLPDVHSDKWRRIISETYEAAQNKNKTLYEVSRRRFRKKESYIKTCVMMSISPAKYYRLLRIFFKLAKRFVGEIFADSKK